MTSTHQFTMKTWADTRSNRRDRTYVVVATNAEEARTEAVELAYAHVRHHVSVVVDIVDVDGTGAPVDCPHGHARLWDGWVLRWDGGRDCHGCADQRSLIAGTLR